MGFAKSVDLPACLPSLMGLEILMSEQQAWEPSSPLGGRVIITSLEVIERVITGGSQQLYAVDITTGLLALFIFYFDLQISSLEIYVYSTLLI